MAVQATQGPRKRSFKNIFMFVLSLGIGAFGVFYSKQYIEDQINIYKSQLDKTEDMVKTIVPSRKLLRGETITGDVLVIREIPVAYADSNRAVSYTHLTLPTKA